MKLAVPGALILIGMIGLLAMGILEGAIPEVGVAELSAPENQEIEVRLIGVIQAIERDIRPMRFTVRDMKDPAALVQVEVDDHRPDIFKVDTDVAVVGRYHSASRTFSGTKIFTKCPSKYEASDAKGSAETYGGGTAGGAAPESPATPPAAQPVPGAQ